MSIQVELRRIVEGRESLSFEEAAALMRSILAGEASDMELATLLGALAARGETGAEVAGFVVAMREVAQGLPLSEAERETLVDTCGTGGDSSGSFNVSTAAALVAAAAGATVAKHGNRAVTSTCGSADVLEALRIPIGLEPAAAADALREHRFCFMLAPSHHPGMNAILPVRRAIKVRSVMHVLGPLLNPAGARRQVMGVYRGRLIPLVAEAMTILGTRHGFVVHGDAGAHGGQDELALSGPSDVAEVRDGFTRTYRVTPEEFGLTQAPLTAVEGGNAPENAAILRAIFAGEPGPRREIVLLNAAAVLVAAGQVGTIGEGVAMAAMAVDTGAVTALVERLGGTGKGG